MWVAIGEGEWKWAHLKPGRCRPFNDAASGKFVQIVYGYCTCIHRKRERQRVCLSLPLSLSLFGGL